MDGGRPGENGSKTPSPFTRKEALRYWLVWAAVIAALAYGIHRYFEYRNAELDKRIERLGN
ncbi:MAG: hypothetical protein AAB316_04685 [Bacteroidota bacterium]